MKNLTESELGYLAGFIDGEGSFIINKRDHVDYKGKRYLGYSAYIDIGNTNRKVLEWIIEKIGVTASIYTSSPKGNRKLAYRIRISYKIAKPLTEKLLPYLIIKQQCARVFLEYSSACVQDKENLHKQMKQLNFRGILDVQRL